MRAAVVQVCRESSILTVAMSAKLTIGQQYSIRTVIVLADFHFSLLIPHSRLRCRFPDSDCFDAIAE